MSAAGKRPSGAYLWDRTFAKNVDQATSETFGIAAVVLMETAGRKVADYVMAATERDAPIVVLVGKGNNGGDALVAARWLAEAGRAVFTYLVVDQAKELVRDLSEDGSAPTDLCEPYALSELNASQLRTLHLCGHSIEPYQPTVLARFNRDSPVILDGVFGLGFRGSMDESSVAYQALTEAAAIPLGQVIALDTPSGLDVDSGNAQKLPLPAHITVTFGGPKPAQELSPARDQCGDVVVLDIGFPAAAVASALKKQQPAFYLPDGNALVLDDPWLELPRSANKYDRGHVLVIGGSAGKTGAPLLSGMSALRCGAGWVSIAMPDSALATVHGELPRELVFEPLFSGEEINVAALAKCLSERRVRAVVIGPGSVESVLTPAVAQELARFTSRGKGLVVLDAGAVHDSLPILSGVSGLQLDSERWLLTPHPGEWKKLGPTAPPAPLTNDSLKETKGLAGRLGITLLYKGATPVVVTGDQATPAYVCTEGTMALARAGSGDLLAGAAGAHGAIGMSATMAVLRAQTVIARAAKLAGAEKGENAVVAEDILAKIGLVAPGPRH